MSAPSRANKAATARPMPLSAPVTSATLPSQPAGAGIEGLPIRLGLELALMTRQIVLADHLDGFGFGHRKVSRR